jgi:hypothetical protein
VRGRHWFGAVFAVGLCLLVASAVSGSADETFLCKDGSSVLIESANRAAMQDHPCVKAWFADDRARREGKYGQAADSPGAEVLPVVHRYTMNRAAALRDLRQRPAYLAWSRARIDQARSDAHNDGKVARLRGPSNVGVTIRVPAGSR